MKEKLKISFDYNENHIFGIKSPILWKHGSDNSMSPLCYFRKPKNVSENEFKDLMILVENKLLKN